MSYLQRLAIGLLTIVGVFSPLANVSALTIRGNVSCNDGITKIVAGDNFTVVATAFDNSIPTGAFTITYPTASSYNIEVDASKLPAGDKSVNLNLKLGGSLDRIVEGINGLAPRIQTIDIGLTKVGTATNTVTATVRGKLYHKDGINGITSPSQYAVDAIDVNSKTFTPTMGVGTDGVPTYTFNFTSTSITGKDKTVTIRYWLGGLGNTLDRVAEGVITNSTRLQTIDINYTAAMEKTIASERHPVSANPSYDSGCDAPRRCGLRLRLGILRGRCR